MADEAFISIRNVSKHFGKVRAVDQVSIDIARGEFFSLLGPSGCGKTTLLRMLAGFEFPSAGEIFIDGQPMSSVPPNRRPVNMVFQNYAIFPHLNVRDNIGYALEYSKLSRTEIDGQIREMLELIRLPGYEARASHELSGGERQRVALARALICRPKVLLLDEPLGALDKRLRESMQLELRELQRSVGITFVFVTHDQEEALTMSDRVAVMSRGRYLQIDTPTRLYEAPINREVANFIGTMNFFEAEVTGVATDTVEVDAGPLGCFPVRHEGERFQTGEQILAAIRPEKFVLTNDRPDKDHAVQGTMNASAYLGERSHFYVSVDGVEKPVSVAAQNVDRADRDRRPLQRQVWLTWSEEAVVLLRPD